MTSKLICLDCDDTLIHHGENKSYIPTSARKAIKMLQAQGHQIALASGRSTFQVADIMSELGIEHAVCFNGHLVIADNQEIHNDPLHPQDLQPLLADLLQNNEHIFAVTTDGMYINDPTGGIKRFISRSMRRGLAGFPPTFSDDTYQLDLTQRLYYFILLFGETLLRQQLPQSDVLRYKTWHADVLEITNNQTSKLTGVQLLCKHLKVDLSNVYAFGDSYNDIELLAGAGQGIAMGKSPLELQDVADFVTANVEDDGLYQACLHYKLI